MVKVSTIIPTFNGANAIKRCLNSIKVQEGVGSLFELEIIVIDDHSSDDTWEILRSEDKVLSLKTLQHSGGPNVGRNIGLIRATGDYITFMDQDDEWHPSKLKLQLEAAQMATIVTCDFQLQDHISGKTHFYSDRSAKVLYFKPNILFKKILSWEKDRKKPLLLLSSLLIHNKLKHIHFEENYGFCDFDYILKITKDQTTSRISSPLVFRHVKDNNLSLNTYYRRVVHYYNQMVLEEYEDQYPKEVKIAARRINGTRARYYYKIGQMKKARKYFLRSGLNWKTVAFWFTTFIGANLVKKHFRIFGT